MSTNVEQTSTEQKIKRPSSAYLLYSISIRKAVKDENPELDSKAVMKLIGQRWKDLPEDQRTPFIQQASVDKERYDKERGELLSKIPQKPKAAVSAYIHFSNTVRNKVREENPGISLGDISKKIGVLWKSLGENDKKVYEDSAKKDVERFKEEMSKFPEGTFPTKTKTSKKSSKAKTEEDKKI